MRRTLVLHGTRAGGRAAGAPTVLALPGPDLFRTEPSVAEAKLARLALLSGAWRMTTKTGSPDAKGDYFLRVKLPMTMLLPPAARHALLRQPPKHGCYWCVARMLTALDLTGTVELVPTDPLLAFLGRPCVRCAIALRDQALRPVLAAAARSWLVASADAHQHRGMNSQDPQLDRIVWWHRRLTTPKVPVPAYYRRRGWPSETGHRDLQAGRAGARQRRAVSRARP